MVTCKIVIDLSKAFNSLNYELVLTKLKVYGLDNNSITFIKSYLSNRFKHCKIYRSFIKWGKVLAGVPQGCI